MFSYKLERRTVIFFKKYKEKYLENKEDLAVQSHW